MTTIMANILFQPIYGKDESQVFELQSVANIMFIANCENPKDFIEKAAERLREVDSIMRNGDWNKWSTVYTVPNKIVQMFWIFDIEC